MRIIGFAVVIALVAAFGYEMAASIRSRVSPVVVTNTVPVDAREAQGGWYWLEQPNGPHAALVKKLPGHAGAVAAADAISGYSVAGATVLWTAKNGSNWMVQVSQGDGPPRTVWSGTDMVEGPCIAGDRIYWVERVPAPVQGDLPMPVLQSSLRVMTATESGGQPTQVCSLLEPSGSVVGPRGTDLIVLGIRPGGCPATALYSVPQGGAPVRLVGEVGISTSIVRSDGSIAWVARSRDSSMQISVSCVREMRKGGQPVTLADWMPANGSLTEVHGSLYYCDGDANPSIWPIHDYSELPEPHHPPTGYMLVAGGDSHVLLRSLKGDKNSVALYEAPIP